MAEKNIKDIKALTTLIYNLSKKHNTNAFIVGGPVRDLIMFKQKHLQLTQDLDIAVENHYASFGQNLAKKLNAKIIHYPQFMTMTLQLKDGSHIDIAQTRKETYPQPAILPKVSPASINEDLYRRDFTINAMAMLITENTPRPILDPFNGKKDIKDNLIRVLHQKSFIDDPTRIFRAIRFAIRFIFTIEKNTARLMKNAIKNNYLILLSGERILYELKMIMLEKKSTDILKSLQQTGIIKNLFNINLPPKFFYKTIMLNTDDKKIIHLFSYLAHAKWSKYPLAKQTTDAAKALKQFSNYRVKLIRAKKPSDLYKILKPLPELSLKILSVIEPKPIKNKIKLYLNKYSKVKIFTTGKTLQQFNLSPGKVFSQIINQLLCLKLDGKIKNKNDELKYIRKTGNV